MGRRRAGTGRNAFPGYFGRSYRRRRSINLSLAKLAPLEAGRRIAQVNGGDATSESAVRTGLEWRERAGTINRTRVRFHHLSPFSGLAPRLFFGQFSFVQFRSVRLRQRIFDQVPVERSAHRHTDVRRRQFQNRGSACLSFLRSVCRRQQIAVLTCQ